jgi:hypothetical protein
VIDISYNKLGILKSRMIWFGEELPSTDGYHFVKCYEYFNDLPCSPPYTKIEEPTFIIDLTKDVDYLFRRVDKRRRQKIRRGYKENVVIDSNTCNKKLLSEFVSLFNKYRINRRGYGPLVLNWTILPLGENIILFRGRHAGQTLIMELIVHDGYIARRFESVRNEALNCPASTYIGGVLWEIILHLKNALPAF